MASKAKDTFVLFEIGHDESVLRLGDLVLYNYKDPLTARHYTCQHKAVGSDTISTSLSKFSVFHKHGPRVGVQLQLANIINLGATLAHERKRLLIAGLAERIILRNPTEYLKDVVLADKSAREALSLWLSATSTDRLRRFKLARNPKIWMLTGLYMFEDVKLVTARSQAAGAEVGLSSELLTALTTIPVGASVTGSKGVSAEISMEIADRKVWAAQYHLVNLKDIHSSEFDTTDAISKITLYPDITSKGLLRNAKASVKTFSVGPFDEAIHAMNDASDEPSQSDTKEDDVAETDFLDALEDTVRLYEEELKPDTSSEEDEDA